MSKKDQYNISVPSGDEFAKSVPKMFWGTGNPNSDIYLSSIMEHLEREDCRDVKTLKYANWCVIGSKLDWIQSGLVNGKSESDLFNKMFRFTDSGGAIGVRVEYLIKVYTDHVALWRNNKLNQIKGNIDDGLIEFLKENYTDYVTLAFKVDNES